jgi:hypothetical protein
MLSVYSPINFWMAESIFTKFGMHIMAPEPISKVYFINPSHLPLCLYVYPPIVAGEQLGKKRYRGKEYTHNNRSIVGRVFFYAVPAVSKESRGLVLSRASCILLHFGDQHIMLQGVLRRIHTICFPIVQISIRRTFLEDIWGGAGRGLLRSSSLSQEGGVVQLALRGT